MGPVGHDLGLADGETMEGSEQEMVEMALAYINIPRAVECSGNCPGARMEAGRPMGGFWGCCNGWDGAGEKWLDT